MLGCPPVYYCVIFEVCFILVTTIIIVLVLHLLFRYLLLSFFFVFILFFVSCFFDCISFLSLVLFVCWFFDSFMIPLILYFPLCWIAYLFFPSVFPQIDEHLAERRIFVTFRVDCINSDTLPKRHFGPQIIVRGSSQQYVPNS